MRVLDKGDVERMYDSEYLDFYTSLARLKSNRPVKRWLDLGSGVTSLELSEIFILEIGELVTRFSMTLQVFKISGKGTENVPSNMLKNNATGEFIVYPRMRYLKGEFQRYRYNSIPYSTSPGAVSFPNLQKLETTCGYSFGDDVLFRGFQRSLCSVKFGLMPDLSIQLSNNHTFTGSASPTGT